MHHSPLTLCPKTKSWCPCQRVKLTLISTSHCLDQDTSIPPKSASPTFDFVHTQISLFLFTWHAQKLTDEKLTDSPSSSVFSKMLWFDLCIVEEEKQKTKAPAKQHLNQISYLLPRYCQLLTQMNLTHRCAVLRCTAHPCSTLIYQAEIAAQLLQEKQKTYTGL